jgi:hypothetical protein
MAIATLTIQVSEEAARAFTQISPEDQRKIQLLLDLRAWFSFALFRVTVTDPDRCPQGVAEKIARKGAGQLRENRAWPSISSQWGWVSPTNNSVGLLPNRSRRSLRRKRR